MDSSSSLLKAGEEVRLYFYRGINAQAVDGIVPYELANPRAKFGLHVVVLGSQVGERDGAGTSIRSCPAILGRCLAGEVYRTEWVVVRFLQNNISHSASTTRTSRIVTYLIERIKGAVINLVRGPRECHVVCHHINHQELYTAVRDYHYFVET